MSPELELSRPEQDVSPRPHENVHEPQDLRQDAAGPHRARHAKGYYYVATGLIAANIYLFAASQGLAAWFHNCNREAATKDCRLRPEQRLLYAQTVGYPA